MKINNEIKNIVQEKYAEIVTQKPSCCSPAAEMDYSAFSLDYTQMEGYMEEADLKLGCGIPTEFANIKEGDTVVDLGSGAGNDVFVARQITGNSGHVIGIDMNYNGEYVRMSDIDVFSQSQDREYSYAGELGVSVFANESTGKTSAVYNFPILSNEDDPENSLSGMWMRIVLDFNSGL